MRISASFFSLAAIFCTCNLASGQVSVPLTAAVGASREAPPVANNAEDVVVLKKRLRDLGISWLPHDDQMDTATINAIKLFQAIVQNKEQINGVDGIVDVGGATHVWLQREDAPKWILLPARGEGFVSHELLNEVHDDHDFGTNWLGDTIAKAGRHYQLHYRSTVDKCALIHINDASRDCGGETKDHIGHESGCSVDIRLPLTNGKAGGVVGDGGYDRNAMRAILTAFHQQPLFEQARLNDPALAAETISVNGKTRPLCVQDPAGSTPVHDNHLHIDIKNP